MDFRNETFIVKKVLKSKHNYKNSKLVIKLVMNIF